MVARRQISPGYGGDITRTHDIIKYAKNCDLNGLKEAISSDAELVNFQEHSTGLSALHIVAAHGHKTCVEFLMSVEGIDATLTDNEGRSAWDLAESIGRDDLVGFIFGQTYKDVLDAIEDDTAWEPQETRAEDRGVIRFPGRSGPSGIA